MNDAPPPLKIVEPAQSAQSAQSAEYAEPCAKDRDQGNAAPGRFVRPVLLIVLPVLLVLGVMGWISIKWGGGFRSTPATLATLERNHETATAPTLSAEALEDLKERVTNTIRRDLMETLKATEILEVRIESTEAQPDGSLLLDFSASYSKAEPGSKPVLRSVSSRLKLEKKDGEWRVTSISPKTSELLFEEEELIQTARKVKKSL